MTPDLEDMVRSDFTLSDRVLEASKKDAAKMKVRQRLTDSRAPGLRVNVYPDGLVAFSVEYKMPGFLTRMHVKVGDWPETTIDEARELAAIVRELGQRGIDVQVGLHTRLVEELKRDGLNWRPALSPPPKKRG